ncbi:zinc finger BED domain-containing protein RICESLEEPER 1-like [Camellia sinensis]|uniref:zinc finger BED domain-containing protein RICESLEEPER 1-like n=1 Tax=Camellia sinensis TaxID=4442 RepID=UPI00103581C8|nr:zinc finger BED domain-containing protein RICESLEEPER 1-like [Camellia sinensis]XP_028118042.1 zinc finger BED domain-containing protein RICESLEEPER 1-like [Camellia sinensis]
MCLLEWNSGCIFSLIVDNASSNNTTIKYLKRKTKDWKGTVLGHEFLHIYCCAHILNLIVSEGLKELDASIACVRDVGSYVRSSPNRLETFKRCVERAKIESRSLLCLDVPTKWNSIYLMLEVAKIFEKAFERMEDEDSNYKSYFSGDVGCDDGEEGSDKKRAPTESDWCNCRMFVKFLRLFYNVTKRFSGSLYVTSNCFFDEMFVIQSKIEQLSRKESKEDELSSLMAKGMKAKFQKYWRNGDKINLLLYVAVVLDPRKKLRHVKFCFSYLYGVEMVNQMMGQVKDYLTRLYNHYIGNDSSSVEVTNTSEQSAMNVDDDCDDLQLFISSQFNSYLDFEYSILFKSEVDAYLAKLCQGTKDEKFDILNW